MDRTKAIFEWIFGVGSTDYELSFLASQNVGLSAEVLKARKEKEQRGLSTVDALASQFTTLPQIWRFINEQHDMYTASKLVERGRADKVNPVVSKLVRDSYGR